MKIEERVQSCTEEEYQNSELPSVYESFIITGLKGGDTNNLVVKGLCEVNFFELDNTSVMLLPKINFNKDWFKEWDYLMLIFSDDPSLEYAGDWMQLGCSRFLFVLEKANIIDKGEWVEVHGEKGKFENIISGRATKRVI